MHRPELTLYCANPLCQASNPVSHRFCQTCRSPLAKRYLWVVGNPKSLYKPGTLLNDRYWWMQENIVLDTKPALLPEFPAEVSEAVEPYLRLIANQPHVPQVYAVVPAPSKTQADLCLLENAPIYPAEVEDTGAQGTPGTLMPAIADAWQAGTGFRQLHWLWQLAQLWETFAQESVTQSLFIPNLIRVEGSLVRLLELHSGKSARLADLGMLWQQWLPGAQPDIAAFLQQLCQQLVEEHIQSSAHLVEVLDRAIALSSQAYSYHLQVGTLTDQGPTRQRNEDACFPGSGSLLSFSLNGSQTLAEMPLAIVCDGIGGHEGGDVASNLAIAALHQKLQPLSSQAPVDANTLTQALEEATLVANDAICQRNDTEQRHERQRMGTTLVMGLGHLHEFYLTHVGDSRAYRITPTGCHQVTLDDDLAAREVRLGYSLYREALRQPSAGSLVQALGMNASNMVRPTVQRFLLDEDCVFLLCSDGLSDHDRVEESWQAQILPVLQGTLDVGTAVQQLVAIANQRNGHDNVTVGLIHCRVTLGSAQPLAIPDSLTIQPASEYVPTVLQSAPREASVKTKNLHPQKQKRSRPSLLTALLIILGLGGLATYFLIRGIDFFEQAGDPFVTAPSPIADPSVPMPPPATVSPNPASSTFAIGTRILVNRATPAGEGIAPIALLPRPMATPDPDVSRSPVSVGSVLEVIEQRQDDSNQRWLGVRVCSTTTAKGQPVTSGELGWVQEVAIAPFVTANVSLTPTQLGVCAAERKVGGSQAPNTSQ
ncbi:MAG: protein phosphatase 2C domain-containing protein [Leptolyngbyaceae cyanobacterium bins.302]|nr:protein phosphatase 2C domain-containing protein [Leptolyngbyaceae cyanobacterium bins.302]